MRTPDGDMKLRLQEQDSKVHGRKYLYFVIVRHESLLSIRYR